MTTFRTAGSTGVPHLYRYQPFHVDRLRAVIVDKNLYFSKPSDFNDPWDCRPCYDLDLSDEESVQGHIAYFVRIDRERNGHLGEAVLAERATRLREDRAFLEELVRRHVDIFEAIDRRFRVLCLARYPTQPLMWAHYARSHTGVCFQFANDSFFGLAPQIVYQDQYPSLSLLSTGAAHIEPLLTKSSDWKYEEEYRLIAQERAAAAAAGTIMTDDHIAIYPTGSLRAVYLGCRMPEADKEAVIDLVHQAGDQREDDQLSVTFDSEVLASCMMASVCPSGSSKNAIHRS